MASGRKIRVMVSSRCGDPVTLDRKRADLTKLRRRMKDSIEKIKPFGELLFEVWINEDSPPIEGSRDSWDQCMVQVRKADILIVLYNGNPGWAAESAGVGICHAELEAGLQAGGAKVYVIALPETKAPKSGPNAKKFEHFRKYFERQNLFTKQVRTGDEALGILPSVIHEAVCELVELGGREIRKGRFDTGEALDWSRQDLATRKNSIEIVIRDAVCDGVHGREDDDRVFLTIDGGMILCLIHAVPAAYTLAAAREMVGRPFHWDHLTEPHLSGTRSGPIHIIGCHKGVTERQAMDLLGRPDVTAVDTPFGILAVDQISSVQCLLLRGCRDDTTTRHAVQRMFDWLGQTGEDVLIAQRSRSRAKIIKVIAKEAKRPRGV